MININISTKVKAAVTQKSDSNIDQRFGNRKEVKNNLERIASKLNIEPSSIIQMQQVHGTNVELVRKQDKGRVIKNVDGLITNKKGIVLMLRVADCIPLFLFDPGKQAIGLIHSGWRGTIGKITLVAIQKMMAELGSKPKDIRLYLGPSIQACCNITQSKPLQTDLPEWKPYITTVKKRWRIDLPAFVKDTAIKAGLNKDKIKSSNICTVMNDNFFSYKKSKRHKQPEGRFGALIALK